LVTGASRGIGAATARALASAGAAVALVARDARSLDDVRAQIVGVGGEALVLPTDVTSQTQTAAMVDEILSWRGRLDIAVNGAAAHGVAPAPLAHVSPSDFDQALAVTLRGTFLCLRAEIPAIAASGGGAIINIGSTAGVRGVGGLVGYVTAKHGLTGLTATAALDYAAQHVRVNLLAPGPIHTERLERAGGSARAAVASAVPSGRLGLPDEVAAAIVWLSGPEAAFITGATIVIDGGLIAAAPSYTPHTTRQGAP
jgi:NAD(P)-dependent dehydrogenase (short-subunit alcohol dehydrogenase family)